MSNFRQSFNGLMPLAVLSATLLTIGGVGSYVEIKKEREQLREQAQQAATVEFRGNCQIIKVEVSDAGKSARLTVPAGCNATRRPTGRGPA